MDTLLGLTTGLMGLFAGGCLFRIVVLLFQAAAEPDRRESFRGEFKHVIVVLILSIAVGGGSVSALVFHYFG